MNMTTKMILTTMSYYPERFAKSIIIVRRSLLSSLQDIEKLLEDQKRRIALMSLQRREFDVVEQYCLHKITERQAMKLLAGKLPDNKPITRYIFRKLVDEYRKMFPDSDEIDADQYNV